MRSDGTGVGGKKQNAWLALTGFYCQYIPTAKIIHFAHGQTPTAGTSFLSLMMGLYGTLKIALTHPRIAPLPVSVHSGYLPPAFMCLIWGLLLITVTSFVMV